MSTCSPVYNLTEISAHSGTLFIACTCEGGFKLRPRLPPLITHFFKKICTDPKDLKHTVQHLATESGEK